MFENLLASLRVVIPMAALMGIGSLIRQAGVIDRPGMRAMDRVTFRLFMPVLLFKNIYDTSLEGGIEGGEVTFAVIGILLVFLFALLVPPKLVADRSKSAAIGQAIVRSNYILFGVAMAESLYGKGNAGPVALLGAIVVPATNALAVIILEIGRSGRTDPRKIFFSILKNPMVIAALLALACKGIGFRFPALLYDVMADVAGVTTTISFISLGVSLDLGELRGNRYPLTVGVILRMAVVPLIFLPITVALGFRGPILCALLVLFAAPAAVGSYPMAVAMGADGQLAGQLVCCTTLVSVFTMFFFTFLVKMLGLL